MVEDLVMVLALVLVPALMPGADAGTVDVSSALLTTFGKIVVFVAVMLVIGARVVPWLLTAVAHTGSRELFTLAVLGIAIGVALGAAELFGVSLALGAFVAGLVVSESDVSHQAAADALPFQDAFAVLFFVSVGMLVDPWVVVNEWQRIGVVLIVVLIGQAATATVLAMLLGRPLHTALTLGAALGQIGEFSFIIAAVGISVGAFPTEARDIILTSAIISIMLNPALFALIGPIERYIESSPRLGRTVRWLSRARRDPIDVVIAGDAERTGHVIIVGYGRVGSAIGDVLGGESIPFVTIDRDRPRVEHMRMRGVHAVYGDAARGGLLQHAGIAGARMLIVTAPEPIHARLVVDEALRLRSDISIVVRVHTEADFTAFQRLGVERVVLGERELAFGMARYALLVMRGGRARSEADVSGDD